MLSPILSISILSSAVIPSVGCSTNKSTNSVELSDDVKKLEITVQNCDVGKGKESWFTLNLPNGKEIESIEVTIGNLTIRSGSGGIKVEENKITISKEKMVDRKIIVKTITLKSKSEIKVTEVKITNTVTSVIVNEKIELTASVLPENAANKELTWTVTASSGSTGAGGIVEEGGKTYLKGLTTGSVDVTATAKDGSGKSDTKTFTINPVLVTKVTITNNPAEVQAGNELELTATVEPDNATNKELTWTVPEGTTTAEIVTKEDGKTYLKGKTAGKVVVTAAAKDDSGKTDNKEFTIVKPTITLGIQNLKLCPTATGTITATVDPSVLAKDVTWTSDDTNIVTVSPGKGATTTITANGTTEGEAIITATVAGESTTCTVSVKKAFADKTWVEIKDYAETFEKSTQDEAAMIALCNNFGDVNYITDGSTIEEHLAKFIGKTHKVTINKKEHVFRVIGINHDKITDEGELKNKQALFTFDTVTLLSDENGDAIISKWDLENNYNYTNSVLRWNLNGNGSGTKPESDVWENSAYSMLPTELKNNIKTVEKSVGISTDSGLKYNATAYNDKLFPLTYTEMGQSGSLYATVEGKPYKYWINKNDDERLKSGVVGSEKEYCLATPNTSADAFVWIVYNNGTFASDSGVDEEVIGVSFAFCI